MIVVCVADIETATNGQDDFVMSLKHAQMIALLMLVSFVVACSKADALYDDGNAYFEEGDYDKAIESFEGVIELDPDYTDAYYRAADAYFMRGRDYADRGNYSNAIADYSAAIKLDPSHPDAYEYAANAYYLRGRSYTDKGEHGAAIRDYEAVMRLDSAHPDVRYHHAVAYYNRGNDYAEAGDFEKAIEDYDKAIELGHHNSEGVRAEKEVAELTLAFIDAFEEFMVSAHDLSRDYQSNEIAAKGKYAAQGNFVAVQGIIDTIGYTLEGSPYIRLVGYNGFGVQANFDLSNEYLLVDLSRGQETTVACTIDSYLFGEVMLQDCVISE